MPDKIRIGRDVWGVPHIYASSEVDVLFGQGYVQALDRLPSIFYAYRMALGRLSEVLGEAWALWDYQQRLHDHASVAQRAFVQLSAEEQALLSAYMRGIVHAIRQHPHLLAYERAAAWQLPHLEDWYPLALARAISYAYVIGHVWAEMGTEPPHGGMIPLLSNAWAVSSTRTQDGCTFLCTDPHAFHSPQWLLHECGLYADDLAVYGFQHPGMPYIRFGHNQHVAWAFTSNGPNAACAVPIKDPPPYVPTFFANNQEWVIECGYENIVFDHFVPLRALNRAQSVAGVEAVLAQQMLGPWHVIAADGNGNIFYQASGRIPRRDEAGNLGAPHPPTELPTLHNPPEGFLVNANGSASTVTPQAPFADVPAYLRCTVPPSFADENTPRGRHLLYTLAAHTEMTLDDALCLVMDDAMPEGVLWRDALLTCAEDLEDPMLVGGLAAWDGRARSDDPVPRWLEDFLVALEEDDPVLFQTIWAQLLQAQPLDASQREFLVQTALTLPNLDAIALLWLKRGDVRLSLNASETLALRVIGAVEGHALPNAEGDGLIGDYGQVGPLLVALGRDGARSWAVVPYGQSDFAAHTHYDDQMPLFARGELRPTHFAKPLDFDTIIENL